MASINELLNAALEHARSGASEDALELCRLAFAKAPNSPRVMRVNGTCLLAAGDFKGAEKCLLGVLELDPNNVEAAHDLGVALKAMDRNEEAELAFERALSIDPEYVSSHEALSILLSEKNDIDNAMRHAMIATNKKPEDAGVVATLASLLMRAGALYDALETYERALQLAPGSPEIVVPLAQIYHELENHAEALSILEKVYLKHPRDPVLTSALAQAHVHIGQFDRAAELVDLTLKLAPGFLPAMDVFGQLTAYSGQPDAGIAKIASELQAKKQPNHYLSLAAAMTRAGKHGDALTILQEAAPERDLVQSTFALTRQVLGVSGRFQELADLTSPMQRRLPVTRSEMAGSKSDIVISLEAKPVEVVLLLRHLAKATLSPMLQKAAPESRIFAPKPLMPLLERADLSFDVAELSSTELNRASEGDDAIFINELSFGDQALDHNPDRFTPYLRSEPAADDYWRGALKPFSPPYAGLAWSKFPPGARLSEIDRALTDWAGTIFSVVWDDQRAELEGRKNIIDAGRHLKSLDAVVDFVEKMDIVLAPDSLVLHIAGAMGKPAIVLTTPDKPWYWYDRGGASYWYPSVQVLERPWEEPMAEFSLRISKKLHDMAPKD